MPFLVSIDSTPVAGLSVIRVAPVSKKALPSVVRLFAGVGELLDRLDAHRRHQQRILLRGRADDAFGDVLDARAAAIDRHDQHVPSMPTAFSAS